MSKEHFESLFQKYLLKTYSPAEREEFFALLNKPENQNLLASLSEKYPVPENATPALDDNTAAEILQAILRTSKQTDDTITDAPIHRMFPRYIRWVAAAAVVLIASGTYLYFRQQGTANRQLPTANQQSTVIDISPGSSKAILTLANGSTIILDSAHNGSIAVQGNTNIIKTDSGKLSYLPTANRQLPTNPSTANRQPPTNTLSTPRGGQFQLTLPDGTHVWLNAASSITYPTAFTTNTRNVSITGEVYLEVVHDKTKPFLVSIPSTPAPQNAGVNREPSTVQVLGTHFNINAYSDESSINTTLLEGSVKVTNNNQSVIIKPGQQAQVSNTIKINDDPNLEEVMAWKNGEMVLRHGNLQKLMNDISRWYDVDVEYAGAIPDGKFSGSIDRNVPLSSVLHVLQAYGVETKLEGKKIIVQ